MSKVFIRKTGSYVRVKTYGGKYRASSSKHWGYKDVGDPGHSQMLLMKDKSGKWITYGWIFKKSDVKNRRLKTMQILKSVGVRESELKRVNL